MASQKQQKACHEQGIHDGGDIISSLPDCILTHILSFLPTKDAVGTCILSTRWRDLWAGLPNIDLDDGLLYFGRLDSWYQFKYEYVPFMKFVERILIHRDISYITKFRLSCRVCFCPSRVSAWISSAISLNVQVLDLCLLLETRFVLPSCVFNCKSLKVLKINMGCALVIPQTVSLPNLKTLHLALVEFLDSESVHKLFSGCPAIEELQLSSCDWRGLDGVTICIPTLRRIRIDDGIYRESHNELSDCRVKLQVANLACFEYFGYLTTEISLHKQSSPLEASVFVRNKSGRAFYTAFCVLKLVNELRNVRVLRLSTDTIKSLSLATRFFRWRPVFQKLTQLELSIGIENNFLASVLEFLRSLPARNPDFCLGT